MKGNENFCASYCPVIEECQMRIAGAAGQRSAVIWMRQMLENNPEIWPPGPARDEAMKRYALEHTEPIQPEDEQLIASHMTESQNVIDIVTEVAPEVYRAQAACSEGPHLTLIGKLVFLREAAESIARYGIKPDVSDREIALMKHAKCSNSLAKAALKKLPKIR